MKEFVKNTYRVLRSVLLSVILLAVALYTIVFILLSIPSVQDKIRETASRELSTFLKGEVSIGKVEISPFSEVIVRDLRVSPKGERPCLEVKTVGAGINLWTLLLERRVELTYARLSGLDFRVVQKAKDGPLNIDFLIEAFKPKEKNKPPTKFNLLFRNVIVRDSKASFDREWRPRGAEGKFDASHISLSGLNIDAEAPCISNDRYEAEVRHLSFRMDCGFTVTDMKASATVTPTSIDLKEFGIEFPSTRVEVSPMMLTFRDFKSIKEAFSDGEKQVEVNAPRLATADFKAFLPILEKFPFNGSLHLTAKGNTSFVQLERLELKPESGAGPALNISGDLSEPLRPEFLAVSLRDLHLAVPSGFIRASVNAIPAIKGKLRNALESLGEIDIKGNGAFSKEDRKASAEIRLTTGAGGLDVKGGITGLGTSGPEVTVTLSSDGIEAGKIAGIPQIGRVSFDFEGEANVGKGFPYADALLEIQGAELYGETVDNTRIELNKEGARIEGMLSCLDNKAKLEGNVSLLMAGAESQIEGILDIDYLDVSRVAQFAKKGIDSVSGAVELQATGNSPDNIRGNLGLQEVCLLGKGSPIFELHSLNAVSTTDDSGYRDMNINSDFLDAYIFGKFRIADLAPALLTMVRPAMPALFQSEPKQPSEDVDLRFNVTAKPDERLYSFLKTPISPLMETYISGGIDTKKGSAEINIDAPILLQGKNKLIRDTHISALTDLGSGTAGITVQTTYPAKKGDVQLVANLMGRQDNLYADILLNPNSESNFSGGIKLSSSIKRDPLQGLSATVDILPSDFVLNGSVWNMPQGRISYSGKRIEVSGLSISHDQQSVDISGVASESPFDVVSVSLRDISLDYIFETLNINYVTFGGQATGLVTGSALFSKYPQATTRRLFVKDLSYNGAVLGDADLKSSFHNDSKMVSIAADIREGTSRRALLDGGIWVTRDSLSFDLDANKVNVRFLQPFMKAFSSDVRGRASGKAKLYGTFSDIDLVGKIRADSLRMKLDFTNVWYSGSDSVFLYPGRIIIPAFRIYDRNGHSGVFTGELTHRYFHDPAFNFKVVMARDLLVYNTDSNINPDWYGTVYGSGSARIDGRPGQIDINVDMSTSPGTKFTMALNDTEAASDYAFLSFSDRRKAEKEKEEEKYVFQDPREAIIERFRKKKKEEESSPTDVTLDIRGSVTPSAEVVVIMDPEAGDKITARGNGSLQMFYDTGNDEMKMYGNYILDEGTYNFSLQDIILKNFTIRQGSSITFSGNPMDATLDISATYRVNTNLSDLDKSFSTDRDLSRTNVPVDALLKVEGPMTRPNIDFDIELPTLTADVTRKVKSIISTDDMMSRQIIYLLALNRFYTPEYTGSSTGNGSELSSVASSTLSSQLSNILSGMTDYLSVAPSFRSDKGDFSDMEVDVALSSRLLDNRLLLNGNFGYRDRSTSTNSSQFIGDFDIEYILTKNGNLRLKAYNHFNDRSYYFKQALTTQGIGVILRKDFDSFRKLFRKSSKKKKKEESPSGTESANKTDSVAVKKDEEKN